MQKIVQVYLPTMLFVIVSWVSFLIKPDIVPGRLGLLVTLFLVLTNVFDGAQQRAPFSSELMAIDEYLIVSICFVVAALLEYAVILILLKNAKKGQRRDCCITTCCDHCCPKGKGEMQNTNVAGLPNENDATCVAKVAPASPPGQRRDNMQLYQEIPLRQDLCAKMDTFSIFVFAILFLAFNIAYCIRYH